MKNAVLILCILFTTGSFNILTAQGADPFREMEEAFERMRQWQQEMMEKGFGDLNVSPNGDSSFFYFHIDTTFSGDGSFFRMPLGDDSFGGSFFFGDGEDLFRRFFGEDPFGGFYDTPSMPKDDGNLEPEDGLLPEERLRLQEEQQKGLDNNPKKSSRVKTIRI